MVCQALREEAQGADRLSVRAGYPGEEAAEVVFETRDKEEIRAFLKTITIDEADSHNTAVALAAAIKEINPDIIFCGQRAIDDDSGQAGSVLAELLGMPQITIVTGFEVDGDKVKAVKPIEGAQLVIESSMPCLITAQKGLNEPRYASLPGIMKAKKKPVDVKDAAALGISVEPKATIVKMTPPPERAPGKIIEGDDPTAKAAELVKLLREEAKVI